MSEILNTESDVDVGAWNKMRKTVSDAGFREGAAAGRQSTFQKGFDIGYHEGYKNSLLLGYLKGAISILEQTETKSWDPVLEKTSRGLCQLCLKPEEQRTSVCDIAEDQKQYVEVAAEKVKTENTILLQGLFSDKQNNSEKTC